jgi:inner membrane protein
MVGDSFTSGAWYTLALALIAIEALRPGRFALWLGFAAILVGVVASVARWPWQAEFAAFAVFAVAAVPVWRRYQRKA